MLPIMPVIANYHRENVNFKCHLPCKESLKRLFRNANWAHYIDPDNYKHVSYSHTGRPRTTWAHYIDPDNHKHSSYEGGHVPALRFGGDETEQATDILGRVMDMILSQLKVERTALKAVEWSLWEIMDNVSNHAESPVGGFVQATAYKNQNQVEFVVADGGIGIPRSMNERNHEQALRKAIDEGVTRDVEKNAGNGLYGSYRVASLSGGIFEIHSARGSLTCKPENGEIVPRQEKIPYAGTSVRCRINTGDSTLLNKALQFKGKTHDPFYDHIERRYEDNTGHLIFHVKEEAQRDLGSRRSGERIRNMIENLLRERRPIILDFNGISIISSSFSDEVFGRLFVEMGPRDFMKRIAMRNVDPTIEGLIDRAIVQRTRLDNGGAG